jgi:hypothetical protein
LSAPVAARDYRDQLLLGGDVGQAAATLAGAALLEHELFLASKDHVDELVDAAAVNL